jgi:putative transcriptional regulator
MTEHSPLGQKIIESLEQAIAYERDTFTPPRVHRVLATGPSTQVEQPPRYDAARIRALRQQLALSQQLFADALNVSLATVRAWEQGPRVPEGATRRLLEITEEHPEYFASKISA